MRIGILTLPLHANFGGILQAYALQTVLTQMGHEAWLIDRRKKTSKTLLLWKVAKRIAKNLIGRQTVIFIEKQQNIAYQFTLPFIQKHICLRTEPFYSEKEMVEGTIKHRFDALIVGSDQIWRPSYFPHIEEAFFSFVKNSSIKKIAYAASFGTEHWEFTDKQTRECAKLVKEFCATSVREHSAVKLCRKYFDIDTAQVLDPTLLLQSTDYLHLLDTTTNDEKAGGLFVYILDETEEKQTVVNNVANYLGYSISRVKTRKRTMGNIPTELSIASSVEEWLRSFYDAEFVITDSFHGCVFSILFNKPFIVYSNKKRGLTRFHSLLEMFDLKNRMINSQSELTTDIISKDIHWNNVNALLDDMRQSSKDFLEQALL